MRIYVGNLSFDTTQEELQKSFEAHGKVSEVRMITDRDTGRAKGFAFVEMPDQTEAQAAIGALNGTQLLQRALTVNEARPRAERGFGVGGGFGGGSRSGGVGNRGGAGGPSGGGFVSRYSAGSGGRSGGGFVSRNGGGGFQDARKHADQGPRQ